MHDRVLQPELMDDPALDADQHAIALAGLARINRISGSSRAVWRAIALDAARLAAASPVTLLDIACGSGDVPLTVARLAAGRGIRLSLTLCDVSPTALSRARDNASTRGFHDIHTRLANVNARGLPFDNSAFSIVTCSLFLHHLDRAACVDLLREMARVAGPRGTVIVSDLRRCAPGLAAAWLVGRMLTRSPIVRVDAIRSVRAAFTVDELRAMAHDAGLHATGALSVTRAFPWRMRLRWRGGAS